MALASIVLNVILIVTISSDKIISHNEQQNRNKLFEKAQQAVNEAYLEAEEAKSETDVDRIRKKVEYHQFIAKELYNEYGRDELRSIMSLLENRLDSIENLKK